MSLFFIVLGVLFLCVLGMSVGVIMGRKPIKHCGAAIDANGNRTECALCGNTTCKNNANALEAQVPQDR